jgi:ATP-binding cassette, subfamily A (ABC1), member 3
VAIRDNSFVVEKGETFGLLGPNGAGKSTTFNVLTAAIPKTHGKVMLNGSEVDRAVDEIFTTVGVCPQFNPLYDELTTSEHLEFFAGIKGLSGDQAREITNFYMKNLQLDEYKDIRSKKLSGGNKRKLCVAMSLVGNPSLVFLDEPSAGVDPIARRYLWNILHSSSA